MCFIVVFVFSYSRKIFDCCLVISEPVIQRSECEIVQRRRIGHDVEQCLAVFDHFSDLETVPASFFLTKYRVRCDVEIEYALDLTSLSAAREQPDHKHHSGDKHHE